MKKTMCLIIAAVLICGSAIIPVNNIHEEVVTASAEIYNEVPDGYTGIYTIDDLYSVRNNLSSNYILMNDIDMSETAPGGDWDNGNGWLPIDGFSGIFDGNGYAIKNMHIYGTIDDGRTCFGLFGSCKEATFINIALINCDINITKPATEKKGLRIGGIVGTNGSNNKTSSALLSHCYVTGNIMVELDCSTITDNYTDYFIGGLTGMSDVQKSFNTCNLSIKIKNGNDYRNHFYIAGISGSWEDVYECYNIGTISVVKEYDSQGSDYADYNIGNIVGGGSKASVDFYSNFYLKSSSDYNATGIVKDINYTNVVGLTEAQMKSQSAFIGFDFDEVWTIDPSAEYPYPTLINVPYVSTQSSVVEPTQPTTKPSAETKKGDINGDGLVDSVDASLILAYYAYISSGGKIDNIDEWMQNG